MNAKKIIILTIAAILIIIATIFSIYYLGGKKEIKIKLNNQPENLSENFSEIKNSEDGNNDLKETEKIKEPDKENIDNANAKSEADISKKNENNQPGVSIKDKLADWGYKKSSNRKIDTIIIHSSYNSLGGDEHSLDKILNIYKNYDVAPHYLISREGKVYRLVEDKNIAYHAGVSKVPDGRTGVNDFSIGVEVINTKSESPNNGQYSALKDLTDYLKNKYKIKYIFGHSDIASGRKDDPWNFNWEKIK
jgi:hypothetical protein